MLRLRDIMTSDVLTLSPELEIRDAMSILSGRHIGGAPVVAQGKVIGMVSATDLLQFAVALPGVPGDEAGQGERSVWDELPGWESEDVPPASWFTELWAESAGEGIDRTPGPEGPEWSALEGHTVSEAMSRGPLCALEPDVPVTAAADYMRRAAVHRILVMEGDRLLGLVSTMDIAGAVADRRLTTKVFLFGDRGVPDQRGWALADDTVSSGEEDEDRVLPASPEIPSGEMEEERAAPTTPEEPT